MLPVLKAASGSCFWKLVFWKDSIALVWVVGSFMLIWALLSSIGSPGFTWRVKQFVSLSRLACAWKTAHRFLSLPSKADRYDGAEGRKRVLRLEFRPFFAQHLYRGDVPAIIGEALADTVKYYYSLKTRQFETGESRLLLEINSKADLPDNVGQMLNPFRVHRLWSFYRSICDFYPDL